MAQEINATIRGKQSNVPYEKKTVVLGGNMVGERNILTQDMLLSEDTKYIIRWAFDLDAKTVIMPAGSSLEFNGGSINNGTIVLNDTPVYPSYNMLTSGSHLTIEGNPSVGTYNYTDGMPVWWNGSEWKRGTDLTEEVEQMQEDIENLQINLENFNPSHRAPIVVPVADEEDITVDKSTNTYKFKDKAYAPALSSGLGRKYLRKNITQRPKSTLASGSWVSYQAGTYLYLLYWYNGTMYNCHKTGGYGLVIGAGQVAEEIANYHVDLLPDYAQENSLEYTIVNNVITITLPDETTIAGSSIHDVTVYEYWENVDDINLLTQEMVSDENTIYIIRYDYILKGNIIIPANCVLEFEGGSISGAYTITGANTGIKAGLVKIFNTDITITGDWFIGSICPEWFGATPDISTADCAPAINKALQFSILGRFHKEVRFQGKRYYCKTHVKIETASDYYIKGIGNATLVASGEPMDYLFGRDGTGSGDAPGVSIRMSNIAFDANYRCNYAVYMPCLSNSNWENVNCISAILCNFFTNYSFIDNFYGCKFYSGDPYNHPTKFDVYLGNQDCNALLFSGCDFEGAYIGAYTNSGYNVVFHTCTFEGLRATGIYSRKTECLNITDCYFEDVSWNRVTDDPTNPKYINPNDLGVTFTTCYQYVSSTSEEYTERNINSFKVHANIIINFKSLELSESLNFQNLILGFWYHSALLLSGRYSPRKCIINNNTFQHIITKNIDNDCNIMCCGGEVVSVNNNSTDAIYISSNGMGQLYTDYKAVNFIVPIVNGVITSGGFGLSSNANHSVIDNSISMPNLTEGNSIATRWSYSPIEQSLKKYPFRYIEFTDNNISIDEYFDVTFDIAETLSHTTNCLFSGGVRIKSGAFVCIETVVNNTTNDIVVIYLDNIEARIPIGTTKIYFYRKYTSDTYIFNLKVSNFNNGLLKFKMPMVQLVDGEIKEQVYYGSSSYRGTLPFKKKGEPFFDTTLNKPVYWTGSAWVDATGTPV